MLNFKFELYKINIEIERSGIKVEFYRPVKNEYKEKTDEVSLLCSLSGVYHEQNSYIKIEGQETTQYRNVKSPMFLTTQTHMPSESLEVGDVFKINGRNFNVIKVQDIQEKGLIFDISLEVEDIGV